MKNTFKSGMPALLAVILCISMTCCQSPAEEEQTQSEEQTPDAVTELTDTAGSGLAKKIRKPLTLIIKNLASATAPVIIGVYKSKKNFLKVEGRLKEYTFTPTGNTLTAIITDLVYGDYAMAIYQDENSSGAIDKNFIGVPTEGYAFSNNFKPKIKAPAFSDCKFIYDSSTNSITMTMIR